MQIIKTPNSILTKKATNVRKIDESTKKLVRDMIITLKKTQNPDGVGLAAPQVGVSKRIFIMRSNPKKPIIVFINPQIIKKIPYEDNSNKNLNDIKKKNKIKKVKKISLEGCLSIQNIWGSVKRAHKVLLKYTTLEGKVFEKWFEGLEATIIQHEIDHLEGILFTQRVLEQKGTLYKEKNGKFEKINI